MKQWIPAILLSLWCCGAVAEEAPKSAFVPPTQEVNAILASVNGRPISLADLLPVTRQEEYQAYAAYSGERLYEVIRDLRRKAVENEIDRQLILEDYRRQTFTIPTQEIQAEVDRLGERMGARSREEFEKQALAAGSSIDKIWKEVEEYLIVQVMIHRRCQAEVSVTPREIHQYFAKHPEEFTRPDSIDLAMILLPADSEKQEENAAKIETTLKESPERFAELARQYSAGPGAEAGGSLGTIEVKRLRPEFAAAMPSPPEAGKVYGPIRTAEGISFLRVTAYHAEEKPEFRKSAAAIRTKLEAAAREETRLKYVEELRKEAVIRLFI